MIGTYEGFFYIFNQKDQKILESRFSNPVSKIFVTSDSALISSYGATVNEVKINDLSVVSAFSSAKSLLMILCILFPAAFIVFLILAVDKLAALFARFLHALVKYKTAYLLLLPTFALLLLFNYYPVVIAFVRSFTDWSKNTASLVDIKFIGFENYKTMFEESYFFTGIKNLVIITLTNFAKTLTVPLLVAELVFAMRSNREKYWFRFLFVLPMVVPGVVSALIWQNIYDPNIGLLNTLFRSWNRVDLARVWLGDPATAIWAIVFMGFPFISAFNFLVYYGGLINIPSSLIEAARVDGSNSFYNFFRIHIPLLGPQFKLLIILTFITSIQDYAGIYLLTGGGPGTATYVPGLELYYNATRFGRYGYACALGVVMFIVILAGSIANIKMQANSEEANS
jgi:ABC-type sugar transport system permease subunit